MSSYHPVKRRLKEAADAGDMKGVKKARRLAEAADAGQISMRSFVRTGQSTLQRVSATRESSKSLFDPAFTTCIRTPSFSCVALMSVVQCD
jgi:hypothetical protein